MTLIVDEKNPRTKETIKTKMLDYVNRAEKLKELVKKKVPVKEGGGAPK